MIAPIHTLKYSTIPNSVFKFTLHCLLQLNFFNFHRQISRKNKKANHQKTLASLMKISHSNQTENQRLMRPK